MAEHLFIKKRQKERRKQTFLTVKLILRLIFASAFLLLGFHYFVGDPTEGLCAAANGCESEYSIATYAVAALVMLGVVIILGGLTGALIAYLRRNRESGGMFSLVNEQEQEPESDRDKHS